MLRIYISVLLAATTIAQEYPCEEGKVINTQPIKNADYMVGIWSYAYHWDHFGPSHFKQNSPLSDSVMGCPTIKFVRIEPDLIKKKKEECGNNKVPFKWEDAKLKMSAPLISIEDAIIFLGENDSWLMTDCKTVIQIEIKKASDDVMVILNPPGSGSEMLTRKPIKWSELNCLTSDMDIGKGLNGISICF